MNGDNFQVLATDDLQRLQLKLPAKCNCIYTILVWKKPVQDMVVVEEKPEFVKVGDVTVHPDSTLALMRQTCKSVGIGTSGGKERCYRRLSEFAKK